MTKKSSLIVAGLMLAACTVSLAATRRFTLSAIFAYCLCPALAAYLGYALFHPERF